VLVVSHAADPVPPDLTDLWNSGFRAYLTFVADQPAADQRLSEWVEATEVGAVVQFVTAPAASVITDILSRYAERYPEERRVIRIRDVQGQFKTVDVTEADEPERPILESYSLIEERDLTPLEPTELKEEEFVEFFRNPEGGWRPYAAGLPWMRDPGMREKVKAILRRLDAVGAEENCIGYLASESGAGGTTIARTLAWEAARDGYPVLVAKSFPFIPEALPVVNFLTRISTLASPSPSVAKISAESTSEEDASDAIRRHYEAPWLIVFDSLHWQYRDSELQQFRNELSKSGRPVLVMIVTGTVLSLAFYNSSVFKRIGELNHAIDLDEARYLGVHLNRFLRAYGKQRESSQWDRFHQEHSVRYLEGVAAFWVALSFWIQGQYDLSESIQQWMYRRFKESDLEPRVQQALLRIAAMSSERLPLPEVLLPSTKGQWPVSHLLSDSASKLTALGLTRIRSNGEKHWALVHDVLGRFLINALFYDFPVRQALGLEGARDSEHLRFLILRDISQETVLGERAYRSLGEDFATSILKIDPDHGHAAFATIWREVLKALDEMPRPLRDGSRVFRHHTAVSRRRIAKLDERLYDINDVDRVQLLKQAIDDINYALTFIAYTQDSESNINLYNSLANAYFDLAEIEVTSGASSERVSELRRLANEATRKAYDENPTNSFVIETYVKNLLHAARESLDQAVERCVEALGILFSALTSNEGAYRAAQLGNLADQALNILFRQTSRDLSTTEPRNPVDVLIRAWGALSAGGQSLRSSFADLPEANREAALEVLSHPAGQGNMQVIRLRYDLLGVTRPKAYRDQLELVEQLQATEYRTTPQLRLDYAILLFLNARAVEGDRVFRSLRRLWHETEHFVQIPERLRWLRTSDGRTLQVVHGVTSSDFGSRAMARVQEFRNQLVPFRPEELGIRNLRPGMRFTCHVSFGHNGPFLRPLTVRPNEDGHV